LTTSSSNKAALTLLVEPWMPLFPARVKKTLRYADTFSLTSTSGAVATHVFAANDLYDPDRTSTGHQPMGFDQMMIFYNHFCVTKAIIKCTFKNASGTFATGLIRQVATPTPITVINQIMEMGGCVSVQLGTPGAMGSSELLDLGLSVAKLQGVTESTMLADSTLRGTSAASPTECTYFHVSSFDAAGNTCALVVDFILEQEAVFTEPRDYTESLKRSVKEESKHFVVVDVRGSK